MSFVRAAASFDWHRCVTVRLAGRFRVSIVSGLLLATAASSSPARAGDPEFKAVVQHIESYYHARHKYGFFLGLAGLAVKIAHPEGVKKLKVALFENRDFSASRGDDRFDAIVQNALSQNWHPMVKVWSNRDGERTYVYAKEPSAKDKDIELFVTSIEPDEAVVVQLKVNLNKLDRFLDDREGIGRFGRGESPHRSGPTFGSSSEGTMVAFR